MEWIDDVARGYMYTYHKGLGVAYYPSSKCVRVFWETTGVYTYTTNLRGTQTIKDDIEQFLLEERPL